MNKEYKSGKSSKNQAEDYRVAFESAGLEIYAMHYPLGKAGEGYPWQDEMTMSLALVIIAKPKSSL